MASLQSLLMWLWVLVQPSAVEGTVVCTPKHPTQDIVVFLTRAGTRAPQPPKEPAVIDQRNLCFTPHVLPVVVGTTVAFPNNDPVYHNVYSPSEAGMFNLGTFAPGVTRMIKFDHPGVVKILCNVHPEMLAYVVVLDTPYYSRTDKDGSFRIANVPSGDYQLSIWCEHTGFHLQKIALTAGHTYTLSSILHKDEAR